MPELAEVEFYRKQWQPGVKHKIRAVQLHPRNRLFRGQSVADLQRTLTGAALLESKAHGKQLLFRFSKNGWLGIHLGMSGSLRLEPPDTPAGKHDHLALRQRGQTLVFSDPRQFGRVLFHCGPTAPSWWTALPAPILSKDFTLAAMTDFLLRHPRAPLKAALLMQRGFPGIGNWMADEILWRAGLHPARLVRALTAAETKKLYRQTRYVCHVALKTIGHNDANPPPSWLFHRRWRRGGHCPRDSQPLRRATIGGRTTCWCPVCQIKRGQA
jgi:formamidopyrimidine-DNA glycosylase